MKYTVQFFADSGNWGAPNGDDVSHANNKKFVNDLLDNWADTVELYDDRMCASALVWIGDFDDVTDLYPDFEVTIGHKGGITWIPA